MTRATPYDLRRIRDRRHLKNGGVLSDLMSTNPRPTRSLAMIDPRAYRFAAGLTAVMLLAGLILGPTWGLAPLAVQTLVFAVGSVMGVRAQPYVALFRKAVRPRLQPAAEMVDARPAQFDQALGVVLTATALLGGLLTLPVLFYVPVLVALVDAVATVVAGQCLGCRLFAQFQRVRARVNDELAATSVRI